MRILFFVAALFLTFAARADDLTLNDLPGILLKLRGCTETKGFLSGSTTLCRVEKGDLFVSVDSEGGLTLFRRRSYGDTIYANGKTVTAMLRDFAAKINADRDSGKEMLDVLAPFLPSQ